MNLEGGTPGRLARQYVPADPRHPRPLDSRLAELHFNPSGESIDLQQPHSRRRARQRPSASVDDPEVAVPADPPESFKRGTLGTEVEVGRSLGLNSSFCLA